MTQLPILKDDKSNNPIISCRYNERLVLHLIRTKQSASKANLARMSGLTAAAIGGIITSLQKKGLVEPAGKIQGDMGQPATLFKLVPEGAFGLGLSINRGSIETLITNFIGEKVTSKKHEMILPEPDKVMEIVAQDIAELREKLGQEYQTRIAGLGVAQPFHLGAWASEHTNWQSWRNFDITEQLSASCKLPVFGENDANAAALAEMVYGLGQTHSDFVYLFFGSSMVTSLGGGIVLGKEFRSGFTGNAGDIGLMPCPPGKLPHRQSKDSHIPVLNSRISLHSLAMHLANCGASVNTPEEFSEAVNQYEADSNVWLDDCVEALEFAAQGIQSVLDIPAIILDCEDRDKGIIQKIVDKLASRMSAVRGTTRPMPEIKMGSLGSKAAAVGAATLPLDYHFSLKPDQK